MRPHWHSASPQLQRNLISLFILSLAQKSPETTLTSPSAAFNSELEYTRSVYDIAAVLRWGLRHLKLEGHSFGSSAPAEEWSWYHQFFRAEQESSYDPQSFTTNLVPEISSAHTALLKSALDTISSLAAHAEVNGYSGSKLAKYFGFWLLTARRAAGTEDWKSFYERWEVSGRMLEHLFLSWLRCAVSIDAFSHGFADAHTRNENTKRPLPRRLEELVTQYPYTTSPTPAVDGLFPRPRFSTRRYGALLVRVEAIYPDSVKTPSSRSPVGIFLDALKSESNSDPWNQIRATAASHPDDRQLPAILSDDTIGLLSLVSIDPQEHALLGIPGPASTIATPLSPVLESFLSPKANGNGTPIRKPSLPSDIPQSPKDWAEFSTAGFGETALSRNFASTLLDTDLEVTEPPIERKPSSRKQNKSTTPSAEFKSPPISPKSALEESESPKLVLASTEVVQLDEAFIEFWRDAIVDPVSSDWPHFVIGELRQPLALHPTPTPPEDGEAPSGNPISWIIVEEKFLKPTPPPTPLFPQEVLSASGGLKVGGSSLRRSSSPRPSFGDRKGSSFTTTLKRFSLFGSSKDDLADDTNSVTGASGKKDSFSGRKKQAGVGKSQKIGEIGEVLSEEPEPLPEKTEGGGDAIDTVATGAVGGAVPTAVAGNDKAQLALLQYLSQRMPGYIRLPKVIRSAGWRPEANRFNRRANGDGLNRVAACASS